MTLNKQKGNMYEFVTHTWNPVRGRCPHNCKYCYMLNFWDIQKSEGQNLNDKTLKDNLDKGNFIFVGSSTDMWADEVPEDWIKKVLAVCNKFDNKYLFQSKNPYRFYEFKDLFPKKTVLGTTIESNKSYHKLTKAPLVDIRTHWMKIMSNKFEIMVTIEPILNFDLEPFVEMIRYIKPKWVNIGADSKGHKMPEPSWAKVSKLIDELSDFTTVKVKSNLKRLSKIEVKKKN